MKKISNGVNVNANNEDGSNDDYEGNYYEKSKIKEWKEKIK